MKVLFIRHIIELLFTNIFPCVNVFILLQFALFITNKMIVAYWLLSCSLHCCWRCCTFLLSLIDCLSYDSSFMVIMFLAVDCCIIVFSLHVTFTRISFRRSLCFCWQLIVTLVETLLRLIVAFILLPRLWRRVAPVILELRQQSADGKDGAERDESNGEGFVENNWKSAKLWSMAWN